MSSRIAIVGVMGSGTSAHTGKASRLGRWLATAGVHLLTGGGAGVMASISKAFFEVEDRRGLVIGVLPCEPGSSRPRPGYPNPWVEIPIVTHLPASGEHGTDPMSRNHINVLSSDVIVALPGGAGTASEVSLALAYERPIVAYLESAADIPGLSADVPVRNSLDAVKDFVSSRIWRS